MLFCGHSSDHPDSSTPTETGWLGELRRASDEPSDTADLTMVLKTLEVSETQIDGLLRPLHHQLEPRSILRHVEDQGPFPRQPHFKHPID